MHMIQGRDDESTEIKARDNNQPYQRDDNALCMSDAFRTARPNSGCVDQLFIGFDSRMWSPSSSPYIQPTRFLVAAESTKEVRAQFFYGAAIPMPSKKAGVLSLPASFDISFEAAPTTSRVGIAARLEAVAGYNRTRGDLPVREKDLSPANCLTLFSRTR